VKRRNVITEGRTPYDPLHVLLEGLALPRNGRASHPPIPPRHALRSGGGPKLLLFGKICRPCVGAPPCALGSKTTEISTPTSPKGHRGSEGGADALAAKGQESAWSRPRSTSEDGKENENKSSSADIVITKKTLPVVVSFIY